jgi:hypothetical protein
VLGGATRSGSTTAIQRIDPASGAIRIVGRLPRPLSEASAFVLGGHVLVAGGMLGRAPSRAVLEFSPGSGRVTTAGQLPVAVADAGVATIGDTVYLVGGETGSRYLDTVIAVR